MADLDFSQIKLPPGYKFVSLTQMGVVGSDDQWIGGIWIAPAGRNKYFTTRVPANTVPSKEFWADIVRQMIISSEDDPLVALMKWEHPDQPELVEQLLAWRAGHPAKQQEKKDG